MIDDLKIVSPLLPPVDVVKAHLDRIWEAEYVTNCGPVHNELETRIGAYLGCPNTTLVANGTLALIGALLAVGVKPGTGGEVITTPYSYIATAQAILQLGLTPVFVDVAAGSENLCPVNARAAVTSNTVAILPVHCYGVPCDVEAFEQLSSDAGVPVVYDAAHSFGAVHNGKSLVSYGNAACLSFHATKVYNTIEGGAVICADPSADERAKRWRNFGYAGETNIDAVGMNAKMSELHAAVGLANLDIVDSALMQRARIMDLYRTAIADIPELDLLPIGTNAPYCPVMVKLPGATARDTLYEHLRSNGILVRRYFYPLITDFKAFAPYAQGKQFDRAAQLAAGVICLPLHHGMQSGDVARVVAELKTGLGATQPRETAQC